MEPRNGASGPSHDPPFDPIGAWRATDAEGKTFLLTIRADGWRDVIEPRGDGWWKVAYAPGVPETGLPDSEGPAYRVDAP